MIEILNVAKNYKEVKALNNVSLNFENGKIYGLLGRNGAGKSTLVKIISNRIFASEGSVLIDGEVVRENEHVLQNMYCMSEENLYPDLKIKDIFKWTKAFYITFDEEQAYRYADLFQLNINKKMKALSTGYTSITKLIIALSMNVSYIIFDEPVLGLDANHRELFYKLLLEEYEKKETTIILATHLIEEVATLIEDVVILDKGQVLLQDSVESIMSKGYSISGIAKDVDAYCEGEHVIGEDVLGGMKIAYIMGDIKEEKRSEQLQISSMNLQKLFVKLTDGGV